MDDDDFLGQARLDIEPVVKQSAVDTWVSLEEVESGQVRLKLYWLPVSIKESDYKSSAGATHSRGEIK
jgi:hypothetical protein